LKTKNISYKHISKYYQEIQTNLGQGIVFESILDYNDIYSKSFEDIIRERRLTNTQEESLLDTLKKYLQENMIVFGDVVLSNILCQEIQPNEFQLIIIDGLGSRRFGWKLWLHIHSTLFTKYRIHKQWKKLMINYRLLKSTT
ncbi:MAG: hypothetical protein KAJ49_08100, partial [Arcobacteraceae bacterium]|nr:hypothetical protein [Arcobacteraceae bacterium]